ncbi:MAG: SoxR reducing system RseC family protein [Prevotella sp.]|nr:SoxR reducing system RseC family protein [Prevotella sp.]
MSRISHEGVVEEVRGDSVRVRIVQTSACAACKVAGHCSAAESKEKVVEVVDGRAAAYAPGDSVVVSIEPSTGRRAVILAFVVPFLILVAVLVVALWVTGDEGVAAIVALASLVPYYLLLHGMERRLARKFSFVINQ